MGLRHANRLYIEKEEGGDGGWLGGDLPPRGGYVLFTFGFLTYRLG